jgi:hypothetical protein
VFATILKSILLVDPVNQGTGMRPTVTEKPKAKLEARFFRLVSLTYLIFPALLGLWIHCLMQTTCHYGGAVVLYLMFPNTVFVLLFAVLSLWWFERLFWGFLFLLAIPWTALVLISVAVG